VTDPDRPPDVEMSGTFRASELTYLEPVRGRLRTEPEEAERVEDHVRENLPPEPEQGRTYRDVHTHWRVGARAHGD
jgi:hypothetical protein